MTLKNGEVGRVYTISDVHIDPIIKRRLQSLGLIKDTSLKVLFNNIKGSMVVKVRGSRLVLGDEITSQIAVQPEEIELASFVAQEELV